MKKHCQSCGLPIKGKPLIYDDYYFHEDGSGCLTTYLDEKIP